MAGLLGFLVAWLISAIIIWAAGMLLGEGGGFLRAIVTALIGAIIYAVADFLFPGILGSLLALLGWLLALKFFFGVGWLKAALMALVIWILALIVGFLLPTLPGPF